jgi:endonuclease G, mitochondrial
VAFLERGRRAAQAVARVAYRNGRGWGSGFMVTDRLFLTNNHVIPDESAARDLCVEFDYELDIRDNPIGKTSFAFDPGTMFVTDLVRGLDFTLIAIGEQLSGPRNLPYYGYCVLSDASDKHAIGEMVNIVQHPRARYKEVVLRENRLVARGKEALHYVADTEPGSSGSPVFNNQWQPVALHHWGGPYRDLIDDRGQRVPREVNEGIRISRIVEALRAKRLELNANRQAILGQALTLWSTAVRPDEALTDVSEATPSAGPSTRRALDGTVTWTFPVEISVRAPLLAPPISDRNAVPVAPAQTTISSALAERALRPDKDYSDRSGYEPGFIAGHVVPLPTLPEALRSKAARNQQARSGDNPLELKYHHFSVVVNADRKLAFFAACNIDGSKSKFINRKDGTVVALDPRNTKHGLMESLLAEGAEASEQWYEDDRLLEGSIAEDDVYDDQTVPGFSNKRSMARTLFQRGHLVRRLDPAWGSKEQARLAEADTFHFTNCAPQVGFFNMGRAQSGPGTGGGKLWRAVENIVLRNARNERTRVCSFTGPIFDNKNDRAFRTVKIPGRYFKIAIWAEEDALRSMAMIADQRPVIDVWPEALFEGEALDPDALGMEAFQAADELERVVDFLTTVEKVQAATGLVFDDAIVAGDIRAGEVDVRPKSLEDVPLGSNGPRRVPARKGAPAKKSRKKPQKKKKARM